MGLYQRWSNKDIRQFVLTILFGAIIVIIALVMLEASLRCVDKDGCLREHCQTEYFLDEYKKLIVNSMTNNDKCKFTNI